MMDEARELLREYFAAHDAYGKDDTLVNARALNEAENAARAFLSRPAAIVPPREPTPIRPSIWAWEDAWKDLPKPVFDAGYSLVDEAIERGADKMDGITPMWCGWALRCAFWSGYHYAVPGAAIAEGKQP